MAPLYDGHDYYKKMFELQEKLRKSEEDRIRLEERFNVLVRESRNRHDTCINRLRMRYIQYLEEQRTRDERNHKLLAALDKVTNKLALINAKKDRLNLLRKQYEAYLLRVYANRRPPGSVTGDSGIASQNEDKCPRKTVVASRPDLVTAETRGDVSSARVVHRAPLQSSQSRSTPASKFHDQSPINSSLLNNPALLAASPPDAPLDVDYHQASVLRASRVHVSPVGQSGDQFAQMSTIPTSDGRQYSRAISDYGGNGDLQDVPNLRVSYTTAPVLSMPPPSEQMQPDAAFVNQFLKQHMEYATPGLSTTTRSPAGEAAQNEIAHLHTPRQFDALTFAQPFQYRDANVLPSDQQPQAKEYVPSNATVAAAAPIAAKLSAYPMISDVNQAGYIDYTPRSPQKSEDEGSIRSLTSDDVDDLMKRNEHLLWRNADVTKPPRRLSVALTATNPDENGKTTAILENELDRYISNIRKLHREHGMQSQEELDHEQNTSGDLLNVTLSEDAQELPVEDKARKERIPEEMGKILALASDLASRKADSREIARPADGNNDVPAEVEDEVGHRVDKRDDALELEGKRDADDGATRHVAEGHDDIAARNGFRGDVATQPTKLEQSREDAKVAGESWNNDDMAESRVSEQEAPSAKGDDAKREEATASSNSGSPVDDARNVAEEKRLVTGEESAIDDEVFDTVEELAPWDLASLQKSVRELRPADPGDERAIERQKAEVGETIGETIASESRVVGQSGAVGEDKSSRSPPDTLPPSEAQTEKSIDNEAESRERNGAGGARVAKAESSESPDGDRRKFDELAVVAPQTDAEVRDESESVKRGISDETRARVDDRAESAEQQNNEYHVEQGYVEDSSRAQQYEEQQQDPNEQYDYSQAQLPYEGVGNEEYERYAEQGYAQQDQEYVEYVEGQYEQYAEDPNQQYQHDPNAQYEQNPAYDYSYGQQYDPGQGYEGDPNQAYEYTENTSYDPNQTYEGVYEQEYKDQQENPENNVAPVDGGREGAGSDDASSQRQMSLEQKADEGKLTTDGVDGGTSQPKKKKDVIKSLLDSDTDTTIERNVSNTESDFDFN